MRAIHQLSTRLSSKYVYTCICVFVYFFLLYAACSRFISLSPVRPFDCKSEKHCHFRGGARVPLVAALYESVCAEVPPHSMTYNYLYTNTCNYTYIRMYVSECVC